MDARTATLGDMTEAMLQFYETVPALGLAADDSDMLLFQFGVYDWGSGEHFEFDITRQFIVEDEVDDDAISQLHCTLLYEPVVDLRTVGRGNRWCHSQQGLSAFRTFILSSEAYMKAVPLPPKLRRIQWERV